MTLLSTGPTTLESRSSGRRSIRLGDVAEFVRGVTFKPADVLKAEDFSGQIVLRTKNVQQELALKEVIRVPASIIKRDEQYVRAGDLVVSTANSWNLVGKCSYVHSVEEPMAIGGFISALRRKTDEVDARYFYRWFSSPLIQETVRGFSAQTTNIANLSLARTLDLAFPLPPLPEQRRIADILDRVDDLRAKRRRSLELLDELADAIFGDAFSEETASRWPTRQLRDLATIQGGLTVNRARSSYELSVPYLRVANVARGRIDLSETKMIGVTEAELQRVRLVTGDLLIVEGHGNAGEVGRVARWNEKDVTMAHQNHLIRARADLSQVTSAYLERYMNSVIARRYFRSVAKTTSGLNTINVSNVKALPVVVPPMEVQSLLDARFEAVERLRVNVNREQRSIDELFSSLQQHAFLGTL